MTRGEEEKSRGARYCALSDQPRSESPMDLSQRKKFRAVAIKYSERAIQPRPGKLDSSGVGKPPLLLRRWGKVIREWDLCKAKEKRLYFQDFVRRDTRWIPNRISPPPSFIRRGNNFCNKIDVTGINIFISPCNRFFYPRSCTYDYPDNLSLLLSLYIYFFPIFSFLIIIFQSLVHQFRWLRRYLRRFATPREEKKKEKYRCWFMVDGRVGEFMRVG